MLSALLTAVGLMLVLEGIMPFLKPEHTRKVLLQLSQIEDRVLRFCGLACMLVGLLLLYAFAGG